MFQLILGLFLGIAISFSAETSKVWGRIIKADHLNYQYFIAYETNGEFFAYPIHVKDKKIKNKLKENVDQFVNVMGELKTITLTSDGRKQVVPVFIAEGISPLSLSQLSVVDQVNTDPKIQTKTKPGYQGGGIQISDTAANTLIIGTAAVMVGSSLLNLIKKK